MKTVTKSNILKLIKMQEEYLKTKDKKLLTEINSFIDNVMNKDKRLFTKLSSYDLTNEQLNTLFSGGMK